MDTLVFGLASQVQAKNSCKGLKTIRFHLAIVGDHAVKVARCETPALYFSLIGVGRLRILGGGQGLEYWGAKGGGGANS